MTATKPVKHAVLFTVALVAALAAMVFVPLIVDRSIEKIVEKERESDRVVTDWRADNWSRSESGRVIEADVYGKKQITARFIGDWDVAGLARVSGDIRKVSVAFLGDVSPGATRPVGLQSFGRWRFIAGEGQRFESGDILVSIGHDIDGAVRLTDAGPFGYIAPPE